MHDITISVLSFYRSHFFDMRCPSCSFAQSNMRRTKKEEHFFVEQYVKYSGVLNEETKNRIVQTLGYCNRCYAFIVSLYSWYRKLFQCWRQKNPLQLNYGNPISPIRLTGQIYSNEVLHAHFINARFHVCQSFHLHVSKEYSRIYLWCLIKLKFISTTCKSMYLNCPGVACASILSSVQ